MKVKKIFFILVSIVFWKLASAQQNTTTAGGKAAGSGGSATYSVGQVDYIAQTGSGGNANQGVQQPYQFTTTKGEEIIGVDLSVFPNPSSSFIILNVPPTAGITRADLYDAGGKLLATEKVAGRQAQIDLKSYSNGTYFLAVFKNEEVIKQFKIIKNR